MSDIKMKSCYVLLDREPSTPKAQLALSAELRNVINERNILTSKTKKKFLSALDEINTSDLNNKKESKKNQAVQEILDSEVVYLKQLEIIMNFFMKPIEQKNILKDQQYEILFSSIKNIYKVNGELLNELKENITNVASAFSKLAPFFKMYSVYAYDYKKCLDMLEKLHKENEEFNKLILNQESRPEVQSKLSYLLITPIQRIPRYCLLLKQVLDNTAPTDPDFNVLKDSLEKLEEVARHVNSLVEERENSQKLLELMRRLKNGKSLVIVPGRKLIKEGTLTKRVDNKNEKVYVILMSDIIMFCKIKKNNALLPNSLKCLFIYPLNKCKISQNNKTKMFEITCQEENTILYHENGSESDKWIKILNTSVNKCLKNRLTLRKGSSSRRPADKNNLTPYMDFGVSPGLERIRKRRRSEDTEYVDKNYEKILKLQDNSSKNVTSCFPVLRLSKRKAIHEAARSSDEEIVNGKDCLFPLRQHLINTNEDNLPSNGEIVPYQPDTFVFGRNHNQNQGFSFKFGNIFSGIGNSVKKVFGFK